MKYLAIVLLLTCVSCKNTKNLHRSSVNKDSVGKSEILTTKETISKENFDTTFTVPEADLFGWWDMGDTADQVIESEDLVVTTKVNPKTGKAKVHAKSKPKQIHVQGNKETTTKETTSDKTEAAVTTKAVTKEKQKESTAQTGTFITIAVVVLLFLLALYLYFKK